jgi:hypothetical protein
MPAPNPAADAANPAKPPPLVKRKHDPRDLCITPEDAAFELLNKRRQIGGRIILDTFLLPTGSNVDVGLDEPFSESEYYFGALDVGTPAPVIMDRPEVKAHQAADTDPIIKKGLMKKDRTIVNLRTTFLRRPGGRRSSMSSPAGTDRLSRSRRRPYG